MGDLHLQSQPGPDYNPEAARLVRQMEVQAKTKYNVYFDVNHRLYYGFSTFDLTTGGNSSRFFYRFKEYCNKMGPNYKKPDYATFKAGLKVVSAKEYALYKKSKGSRFRQI